MNIIDVEQQYQSYRLTLQQSPLYKQFKSEKREFKNLIHQYIDAGGSRDSLNGKTVICYNNVNQDRIAKKITKHFNLHARMEKKACLETLVQEIREASRKLLITYKKIDTAIWVVRNPLWRPLWMSKHEDVFINYREYLNAKKNHERIKKGITTP